MGVTCDRAFGCVSEMLRNDNPAPSGSGAPSPCLRGDQCSCQALTA